MESYTPKELVRAPARLGAEVNYELEFEKSDDGYERDGIFEWFTGISYRFGRNWSAGFEFWKHHEFADATVHEHSAYFVGPRIHMETSAGGPRSASSTSC